ncbi:protein kinase domain-containing protein [Blastococcus brunescens]|uniref:Protein kinase n=1 Tax=Blastococcus brunescens TaxID=1564165 RepID=A0ABZ1AV30_9ACTN|nr:protein kinase [Blastococcus sp. BMG 8361]WRL62430.1 protein kinase [Blastococcus sp. BMG 8361]
MPRTRWSAASSSSHAGGRSDRRSARAGLAGSSRPPRTTGHRRPSSWSGRRPAHPASSSSSRGRRRPQHRPRAGLRETADAYVIVMPLAEESLQDRLDAAGGPLPLEDALAVLTDVATALADLDGRVVHRDLKPANVLLVDGAWCLADFGISRYADATTAPDTRRMAMSPPYAAPERWRAARATAAADVYAVGVMAFQLLSGDLPFPGPGWEDFHDQHLHAEPPALATASPGWPRSSRSACTRPPRPGRCRRTCSPGCRRPRRAPRRPAWQPWPGPTSATPSSVGLTRSPHRARRRSKSAVASSPTRLAGHSSGPPPRCSRPSPTSPPAPSSGVAPRVGAWNSTGCRSGCPRRSRSTM